jgi:hypothetical protein
MASSIALSIGGCYLAHERGDPVDADVPDAALPADAAVPSDATVASDATVPDAPSPYDCHVACTAPVRLGALSFPRPLSGDTYLENVVLTPDAVYGVMLVSRDTNVPLPTRGGHTVVFDYLPAVFRFDRRTGASRWLEPLQHTGTVSMKGAAVRVVGDQVRLTMLEGEHADTGAHLRAMVGTATWSLDGALVRESPEVMRAPDLLTTPRVGHSTDGMCGVFGAGTRDLAVYMDGDRVEAFVLDDGAAPRLVTLAHALDTGPLAPVGGAILDDGRIALGGGGWPSLFGLDDLRAAFVGVGALEAAPLDVSAAPGVIQNPPPLVTREPTGFAMMRYEGRTPTARDTDILISHRDFEGIVLREAHLPRPDTRRPAFMAAFDTPSGAGLVWVEQNDDSTEDARLMWPGLEHACDAPAFEPILHLEAWTGGIAAASDGGAVYVVSSRNGVEAGSYHTEVTLYRVDACERE